MVRLATQKLRMRKRRELEHRVAGAGLVDDEEGEAGDADDQRRPDDRVAPAAGRLLDQGEDRAAEPGRRERDSRPVDAAEGVGVAALFDRVQGQGHRGRDQRQVDPEDRPPGERLDQRPSSGRAEHGGDPGPGGPGADRLAPRGVPRRWRRRSPASPAPAVPLRSPAGRGRRSGPRPWARSRRATRWRQRRSGRRRTSADGRTGRRASRRPAAARPGSACRPRPPTAARPARRRGRR